MDKRSSLLSTRRGTLSVLSRSEGASGSPSQTCTKTRDCTCCRHKDARTHSDLQHKDGVKEAIKCSFGSYFAFWLISKIQLDLTPFCYSAAGLNCLCDNFWWVFVSACVGVFWGPYQTGPMDCLMWCDKGHIERTPLPVNMPDVDKPSAPHTEWEDKRYGMRGGGGWQETRNKASGSL